MQYVFTCMLHRKFELTPIKFEFLKLLQNHVKDNNMERQQYTHTHTHTHI